MVWPLLYQFLSIKKLTIVTTFTTFVLDLNEKLDGSPEEREMHRKRQAILLHALVQAADFYITISRSKENIRHGPDCELQIRSNIGSQKIPYSMLLWDKDSCKFTAPVIKGSLLKDQNSNNITQTIISKK